MIDLIFFALMLLALYKGMRRGLVVAVFSMLGLIVGLAAAVKFSAVLTQHLHHNLNFSTKWLPILAFISVFVCVMLAVRWAANVIDLAVRWAFLEWINKLGAVLLYAALYTAIYSVFLFYARYGGLLTEHAIDSSRMYLWIEPWGPSVVGFVGRIIPIFRGMFIQLEDFFEHLSHHLS